MITKLKLENFTAFSKLEFEPSPGINVLIGANGTGKTHLMKVAYSACEISSSKKDFVEKLINVFRPRNKTIGRLARRESNDKSCLIEVYRGNISLRTKFTKRTVKPKSAVVVGERNWIKDPVKCVYIPPKEILSNAPGFRSLYSQREISFSEVYADLLDRAYLPALRSPVDRFRKRLMNTIQEVLGGQVIILKEEFLLKDKQGHLEFTLLAEGLRKLGLLWLLVRNGSLITGSILFWDEPETNLNPKLFGPLIEILLELQRTGVQIFLATHDYVILKELDLRTKADDEVVFHSLYRDDKTKEIEIHSTNKYLEIHPNAIAETFTDIYNREIRRSLGEI